MKIKELLNQSTGSAETTHIYDRSTNRIWTAEDHGHLRAVGRDFAAGRMMIPKVKKI